VILQKYQEAGLLFNVNFLEKTSTDGVYGYRGELILIEGEKGDAQGHTKPPVEVMHGAVMLGGEQLLMVVGSLDKVSSLPVFLKKYQADLAPNAKVVMYVVNAKSAAQVLLDGVPCVLIPLVQGVPWNEITETLGLDKSDFKGQTPGNKIMTTYNQLKNYTPKFPVVPFAEVLAAATQAVRENWGAI